MKPFDLEAAKNGAPVVTRDGLPARIICFDRKSEDFPLVALILHPNGYESMRIFRENGCLNIGGIESTFDLLMPPVKREGWINIYPSGDKFLTGAKIHETQESAQSARDANNFLATVRIEWEE